MSQDFSVVLDSVPEGLQVGCGSNRGCKVAHLAIAAPWTVGGSC